ncbi:MAG TPA: YceI family protein [Thermoanaerobaculia bacterium]|jgi:polyisoprenoid-binding protein YceI|nr:YceI family protein [Thermoanaerobaculia bacterium]
MTRTLALVALLLAFPAFAETRSYTIAADGKNHASFESAATLENIKGTATRLSGTIAADPSNPAASSVDLTIDVASLDTGISMRNEHLREHYLAAEKFPTMSFKSVSVTSPLRAIAPNQPVDVSVTGDMTLHGVTKRVTVPVRVVIIPESDLTKASRGAGDWIHATTTFPIKLTDFGIEVPEKMLMKVSNDISIKVDVFALATQ